MTDTWELDSPASVARHRKEFYAGLVDSVRHRIISTGGFHNRNYRVLLRSPEAALLGLESGTSLLLRVRRPAPEVVRRIWPDESELLGMLASGSSDVDVPRVLHHDGDGIAVLVYIEGRTVEEACPSGESVPAEWVEQIAGFFGRLVGVKANELPQLPKDWPADEDSTAFLRAMVRFAEERLAEANQEEFGRLFHGLGIPDDAMARFAGSLPGLTSRPFALLHTDVHRRNIVIDAEHRLRFIDWEHAMFGDPVYDLATHLCRMRYPRRQEQQVVGAWRQAVGSADPRLVRGLDRDLPHYLDYERAQSVYPDVIRAALSLGVECEGATLQQAVRRTESALRAAAVPLGSAFVPTSDDIGRRLSEWHRNSRSSTSGWRG